MRLGCFGLALSGMWVWIRKEMLRGSGFSRKVINGA